MSGGGAAGPSAARGLHPLLDEIDELIRDAGHLVQARVVCEVTSRHGTRLPIHAITLGDAAPTAPAVGIFGGVHGLERIGTEVALAFLRSLVQRARWDATLAPLLAGTRLVFMPLVNPGGMLRGTRANLQGVDLMRNAPVECTGPGAPPLLRGQRVSRALPWYRGAAGATMQPEAQALCDTVRHELFGHVFALSIDCHSGFGLTDRIWFPHAHTRAPIHHLPELHALSGLLDRNLVHHRYRFEPQSRQYLTHGDLWDHLYLLARERPGQVFLPLTLEMGSWLWVKKNPRQVFTRHGLFNPLIEHRQQRVLRRHLALLDFFVRAAFNHTRWCPAPAARETEHAAAVVRWYAAASGRSQR